MLPNELRSSHQPRHTDKSATNNRRVDSRSFNDCPVEVKARPDNARVNRATSKGLNLRVEWMAKWRSQPSAKRADPDARCRFGSTLCYPGNWPLRSPHPSKLAYRSRAYCQQESSTARAWWFRQTFSSFSRPGHRMLSTPKPRLRPSMPEYRPSGIRA